MFNAIQKLELLKQEGHFPNAIFIHCRGNDIGRSFVGKIRLAIIKLLQYPTREFPSTLHLVTYFVQTYMALI